VAGTRFVLRRADPGDFAAVRNLLREASRWLRTKDTDQWAVPWPDESGRNENIRRAIAAGRTWILWCGEQVAATLTASPDDHKIWPEEIRHEKAVYVRRIAVSRRYARLGLGGQLLDWAGLRAEREYSARWIRVDVWTTNTELHDYYRRQGFVYCGLSLVPDYPSAALFQKPIAQVDEASVTQFAEAGPGLSEQPGFRRRLRE
jgi:ribosomal protein S18 acetylase RimI-like enzyme